MLAGRQHHARIADPYTCAVSKRHESPGLRPPVAPHFLHLEADIHRLARFAPVARGEVALDATLDRIALGTYPDRLRYEREPSRSTVTSLKK